MDWDQTQIQNLDHYRVLSVLPVVAAKLGKRCCGCAERVTTYRDRDRSLLPCSHDTNESQRATDTGLYLVPPSKCRRAVSQALQIMTKIRFPMTHYTEWKQL